MTKDSYDLSESDPYWLKWSKMVGLFFQILCVWVLDSQSKKQISITIKIKIKTSEGIFPIELSSASPLHRAM